MRKLLIIAGSAGAIEVVRKLLSHLSKDIDYSVIVLIHQKEQCLVSLANSLRDSTTLPVVDPEDGVELLNGFIYAAPPLYHMQVEQNYHISYALDDRVKFSRPSIDVLLQTAAWTYHKNLRVVILSGSSSDGADGAQKVLSYGGKVYVHDPEEAQVAIMPKSVLEACQISKAYQLKDLTEMLKYWRS